MKIDLSADEKKLIEHSKRSIVKYNKMRHGRGGIDTLYSFLLSKRGKLYDGSCMETNIGHANICAERHAIANLIMNESYGSEIKSIVIADPVPEKQEKSTPPCGTCRHLIWAYGNPKTSVILMQYVMTKKGWIFPKIEKHLIKDLYPYPYDPVEGLWENFEPKRCWSINRPSNPNND